MKTLDDKASPLANSMRNIVGQMDPTAMTADMTPQEMLTAYPMLKDRLGFQLDREKMNKEDPKKALRSGLTKIEGWELKPEFDVRPEEAEKFRRKQAVANRADTVSKRLASAVGKDGKFNPNDGQAVADAFEFMMLLKQDKELGALAGPDMGVLNQVAPNVTALQFSDIIRTNPGIASAMQGAARNVRAKVDEEIGQAYQKVPGMPAPAAPEAAPQMDPNSPPPGMKAQRNKRTGEVRFVPIQ
jgi:hypothetical protein